MKVVPKPSPNSGKNSPTAAISRPTQEWTVKFNHQGHSFQVFKRELSKAGKYYIRFEHNKKLYKKSLKTNVSTVALDRAKKYIDIVYNSEWEALDKLKRPSNVTLSQVFAKYDHLAMIDRRSIRNNKSSMLLICRRVHGQDDPALIPLRLIDAALVHRFQTHYVQDYEALSNQDHESQRIARERALRSSRSIVQQARSLFNKTKELPAKYAAEGVILPACIDGFMSAKLEGRMRKLEYLAPPDELVQKAFTEIESQKETQPEVYLGFWFAVGAGLRREEIQRLRWEHLIVRDGATWVSGGIGKDGERIEVPMQFRAVEAIKDFRKTEGFVMPLRGLEWAKRINHWMTGLGWKTEKKLHELRAYVGSLIYQKNPLLAMKFMRHKSIRVTEQFYCRYGKELKPVDVL